MSAKPLTLLKAARIAEAQQRTEEAYQEVQAAKLVVKDATTELANANTEALKKSVEEKLHTAKERLSNAQSRAEYEQSQLDQLLGCGRSSWWIALFQYSIFGLLAAIVLGFLMYGVVNDKLLSSLATIATARGLITFLITVVTVTIALVLALATIVSESPDRIQRFQNGKDLLTVLIGILGTIVGFYFGQSTDTAKGLNIAPVYISNETPKAGETINLVAFVSGGKAPYSYDILFAPNIIADIKQKQSLDGQIIANIAAVAVTADTQVSFSIRVKDSEGKEASFDSKETGKKLVLKK